MEPKDLIAGIALLVSLTSLIISVFTQRSERIQAFIEGLRGDRRSVTYAALTIRLSHLLKQDSYRKSLIASLLLAWNFETSDRARAAVLAALVDAKQNYADDYSNVVADLEQRFLDYERAVEKGDIERGRSRMNDVKAAVIKASETVGEQERILIT